MYDQLRAIAERSFSDERRGSGASDHTLSPTALVHEAFLKLSRAEERGTLQTLESREFFPAAARAMREILVDHARRRRARLEGEGRMIKLVGARDVPAFGSRFLDSGPTRAADVIDLDRVLAALEAIDPDAACLVSLRFFAGLTVEQSSRVLGLGQTATEGLWRFARAWMGRALTQ